MGPLVKTPEQIEGIRASCKLASEALRFAGQLVRPGVSTSDVNREVYKFIKERGGESATKGYLGFPSETCTSVNEVVCHGIPSDSVILREGDLFKIDIATVLNGYYGDTCGTFPVGRVSKKTAAFVEDVRHCLNIGIDQCRPGKHISSIGYAIGRFCRQMGYGIVMSLCGHGVGIAFHEPPQVSHDADSPNQGHVMEPGNIFTVEPMINQKGAEVSLAEDGWTVVTMDGSLSGQFEHTILITPDGHEILTT